MRRRSFIKTLCATGLLYSSGGLPSLGKLARAGSFPPLGNRVLVNIMLSGAPDFRHLFTPPFDQSPSSYGYRYWQARAAAHSIAESSAAYQKRWENDYFPVNDGATSFGILGKCGWLKRQWDIGNVAIVSNAVSGTSRNHTHCRLIMEQGNLTSGPNDAGRSGWGGRLASYAGGNVLALTRAPRHFTWGLDTSNPDGHDNRNLISVRDTREFALYRPDASENPLSQRSHIARSLRGYYEALEQEVPQDSAYHEFVEQERKLREFGELVEARLASEPLPGSIEALMYGSLSRPYLGEQIRNLYDSFICSDIFAQQVVSLELDGWDTHHSQRDVIEPMFEDLFGTGKALDTLYQELPASTLDGTVITIGGEFGRQLRANGDNGTDHGQGTYVLIIGNGVKGGVYGDMFPLAELERLDDRSPEITGLTTIDAIYAQICDWIQPGTSGLVFPDQSLTRVEPGANLESLFL